MKINLFSKSISIDVIAVILAGFILTALNLRNDLIYSPDSITYMKWADLLIHHNFNFFNYYRDNNFFTPSIFYTIPVSIIAVLRFLFEATWDSIFYAINIFSMLVVIELFRRCLRLLKIHPPIIALMTVFFLVSPFIYWPHYLLSDTIFASLVMALIYSTIFAITNKNSVIPAVLFCLLLILTRPTGIPYAFGTILFIIFYRFGFLSFDSRHASWILFFLFLLTTFAYGLIFLLELKNPSGSIQMKFISDMIITGVVIHDRPDTFIDMNLNFIEISRLFSMRFLMLFSPYASTYSYAHVAANSILLAPFIISIILFIFYTLSKARKDIGFEFLILIIIVFVGVFHAATLIDFDWRYRYPIIAPMLIFSALILQNSLISLKIIKIGISD